MPRALAGGKKKIITQDAVFWTNKAIASPRRVMGGLRYPSIQMKGVFWSFERRRERLFLYMNLRRGKDHLILDNIFSTR